MEGFKTEKILVETIKAAVPKIRNKRNEFAPKTAGFVGFWFGCFLTEILKRNKDLNFRGKWIDTIEFRELHCSSNKSEISGSGLIWWGCKNDPTYETFPDTFYCRLKLENEKNLLVSHFISFWIDRKKYELKKDCVS